MGFFDTKQQRASWMVAILGILIVLALMPYASGLLAAPVLYILMAPLHEWLVPRVKHRGVATTMVIILTLVCIVLPFSWMLSMLVGQAQDAAPAVVESPVLDEFDTLTIGPFAILASPKTEGHSPKARLVVTITELRS
jgi:predicted PurR-regulated permease PerM